MIHATIARLVITALFAVILLLQPLAGDISADGAWGGADILHVPMSWCVVNETPAEDDFMHMGESSTDTLIWRRHERPTDNIFIGPAGISFRSAINNIWTGNLSFPDINDPALNVGSTITGEVSAANLPDNQEFQDLLQNCRAAWASIPDVDDQITGTHGVIGIMAINIDLLHNPDGSYSQTIGWGGCEELTPTSDCTAPGERYIVASDNRYFFPVNGAVTPKPDGDNFKHDPHDQLVGHELGRALGLPDSTDPNALMFATQEDNIPDNVTDNIALSTSEVNALRAAAETVDGLETDPDHVFNPGRFAAVRRVDATRERDDVPRHLDLAGIKVSIDKAEGIVYLDQQLLGIAPERDARYSAWYLIDSESEQGATPESLAEIGVPVNAFTGVDVVIRVDVEGRTVVDAEGFYIISDDEFEPIDDLSGLLRTLVMYPLFSEPLESGSEPIENRGYPVYDAVSVKVPASAVGIGMDQPFTIQTLITDIEDRNVFDRLDDTEEERGRTVVISDPVFPHCFPEGDAEPGSTVQVRFDGLVPNASVHALLGPISAGTGEADEVGTGMVEIGITDETTDGFHLVTIGTDETALTADCRN